MNIDDELRDYFSHQSSVPDDIKHALSTALREANAPAEQYHALWLAGVAHVFASLMALAGLWVLTTPVVALVAGLVYYVFISVSATLLIGLMLQNKKEVLPC